MAKDGSQSARGGSVASRQKAGAAPQNLHSLNFLKSVERVADNFIGAEDRSVEDVRKILLQVRSQYDLVHLEAEQKEARLRGLREQIRAADSSHDGRADENHRLEDSFVQLKDQYGLTTRRIEETRTSKKVYEHMLARIQKEQAILKEKMLRMEEHMNRKTSELHKRISEGERNKREKVLRSGTLDSLERDAGNERDACTAARDVMEGEIERRIDAKQRRQDFESWRHEVAMEAATEAFNASAGRLRKLYAIEKLAGNCLQKITFEQVERSQTTENGFQQIRDVTGLADVMDIVHKFLNREVEHEQLRGSVKEAEVRLEALRATFDDAKRQTEGITFDSNAASSFGDIYKHVEEKDRILSECLKEHETKRMQLQKTTLQVEHMKRWTARVGQLLSAFEDPVQVQGPSDLPTFFRKLDSAVQKFLAYVGKQMGESKINRKILSQVLTRENNDQARLLANVDFLKSNCRVPASADHRPSSKQGGGVDDDPDNLFAVDRDNRKTDSQEALARAQAVEAQKKRQKDR